MKFETFDRLTLFGRRWFFRLVAANGEPVAQSEAYNSAQSRDKEIANIRRDAPKAATRERRR